MPVCVVCQGVALVYCKEDEAYLCFKCDDLVHKNNIVVAGHHRVPVEVQDQEQSKTQQLDKNKQNMAKKCTQTQFGELRRSGEKCITIDSVIVPQSLNDSYKEVDSDHRANGSDSDNGRNEINELFKELESTGKDDMFGRGWEDGMTAVNLDNMDMLFGSKDSSQEQDVAALLEPVPTGNPEKSVQPDHQGFFTRMLPDYQHPVTPNTIDKVDSNASCQSILNYNNFIGEPFVYHHQHQHGHHHHHHHHQMLMNRMRRQSVQPEMQSASPSATAQQSFQNQYGQSKYTCKDPDRAAKLARYRAKRARRNFKKTIRYESRKAYAEVRPRIKGRFATKAEVEAMKAAQNAYYSNVNTSDQSSNNDAPPTPEQRTDDMNEQFYLTGFDQAGGQPGFVFIPQQM